MRRLTTILTSLAVFATMAAAQVPDPILEGPITSPGSAFIQGTAFDLGELGYQQEEYFFSGTARAFTNVGPLEDDGLWTVTPGDTAEYKSRFVVIRPVNKKKFNGSVVVEWLNVSAGLDAAPDWILAHTQLMREGFAWVGVSAQFIGVEGGGGLLPVADLGLKVVAPGRYGSLNHPGDSFSYDIFSQAAAALLTPSGPLGELTVKRLIAAGEPQSAFRMVTYANAIHPLARLFDGFFIHSRGAFPAPLSEAPQPAITVPGTAQIRADIDVPVLTLETESDMTFLGYFAARQDDGENFRLWEAAGTAHADLYVAIQGAIDTGTSPDIVAPVEVSSPLPGFIDCDFPLNTGPHHFVVKAALSALNRWVRTGKAPKSAPRLEIDPGPPVTIVTDEHGNAVGGIRTPQVDAPIAAFTGIQSGSILCMLFGTTELFDDAKLATLYPKKNSFRKAFNKAIKRSVRAGWITKPDGKLMKKWAKSANVGG